MGSVKLASPYNPIQPKVGQLRQVSDRNSRLFGSTYLVLSEFGIDPHTDWEVLVEGQIHNRSGAFIACDVILSDPGEEQ